MVGIMEESGRLRGAMALFSPWTSPFFFFPWWVFVIGACVVGTLYARTL